MSATSTPALDMASPASGTTTPSRFTNQQETLEDALKTHTVGLVHLSEFKKRRAELAEQRDREAAEKLAPIVATSRENSATPPGTAAARKKKKRKNAGAKLSFGGDDEDGAEAEAIVTTELEAVLGAVVKNGSSKGREGSEEHDRDSSESASEVKKRKFNPKLKAPPPKALTKSTLLREAQEREMLRREFLQLQEAIKNEDISIPFVFYDGTNVAPPTGEGVTVKKGEAVWLFLERARRMSGRREWLRVSVDDLLLVRGEVIIPHHYEFYYFIANRTVGPNGILFDYPSPLDPSNTKPGAEKPETTQGGKEDPTMTKVVDRRWYERNKHIFPASIWTEFDPNVNYADMVRRDLGGNAFFFG